MPSVCSRVTHTEATGNGSHTANVTATTKDPCAKVSAFVVQLLNLFTYRLANGVNKLCYI